MLNWQQALRVKAQSKCWDEDTRLGPAAQTEPRPRGWGQHCRTQCTAQWVRWASKGRPQCGTSEAGGPCRGVGFRLGAPPLSWCPSDDTQRHIHTVPLRDWPRRPSPQLRQLLKTTPLTLFCRIWHVVIEADEAILSPVCLSVTRGKRNRVLTKYFTMKRRYCRLAGWLWNHLRVYQVKVIIKVFCLDVKTNDGMLCELLLVTVTSTCGLGCCHRMINGTLFLFSLLLLCLSDWW